jgi:hypothetical protein
VGSSCRLTSGSALVLARADHTAALLKGLVNKFA